MVGFVASCGFSQEHEREWGGLKSGDTKGKRVHELFRWNVRHSNEHFGSIEVSFPYAVSKLLYGVGVVRPGVQPLGIFGDMKILVIEDDEETALYLVKGLTEEGYIVDISVHGQEGFMQAMDEIYKVLIVDRLLPGIDGISLVRRLRAANVKTPVLFLSALGEIEQRVEGLEAGGDDYLSKPFAFSEL